MKKRRFRWILPLLRYGLCAAAIWYLVTKVRWHDEIHLSDAPRTAVRLLEDRGDSFVVLRDGERVTLGLSDVHRIDNETTPDIEYGIAGVVQRVDLWRAWLAILLFFPVPILQSLRLVWMLAIQEIRVSTWMSAKLSLAGNFFDFALPGTTGGDVFKAYYLTRLTPKRTEAVTTVFLDRAVGLLGMVLLAAIMIAVSWDEQRFGNIARPMLVILAALALGSPLVFSRRIRALLRLRDIAERLPFGHHILRIGGAIVAMRRHPMLLIVSVASTLILQFFVMVSAYQMSLALGMTASFGQCLVYVAIGQLMAAIPISPPQAFGVMEWAFIQFFTHQGLATSAQAVTFALAIRLIKLVWALPGVLVPLLGAHYPTAREVEELEEDVEATERRP
ncbi:MAG: flippase-like domain-containing protein [Phycisphaerales bacterium]|nr:flippase-like domain-containing protein [Phycisphaerales bacterium]